MTPEEVAKLRTWYRMATDRGDAKVSRSQAQAELWNLLTCEGWQGPLDRIRMGEGVLPKLLDMAERCADYDRRLGAVMPADFKDWHQNSPKEWPEVAAGVVTNLRKREDWAHEQMARALERAAAIHRVLVAAREVAGNTADDIDERLRYVEVRPGRDEWRELVDALRALDDKEQRTMTTDDETIIFEMDSCSPSGERRTSRSRWDSIFSAVYRMDSLRACGWRFSPVRVYVGTMGTLEQAVARIQEKLR